MGGKGKLLWLIDRLAPASYARFVDVFGGSGTVTLNRPLRRGCAEIYNDYNSSLANLFCCVKDRPMALLRELGFLPLNARDDFNVLYRGPLHGGLHILPPAQLEQDRLAGLQ